MKTLYLNNSGTRWRNFYTSKECGIGKPEVHTWVTKLGKQIHRTVIFWETFGNFATATISYKGKKISVFSDTVLED